MKRFTLWVSAALLLFVLPACDDLLKVDAPTLVSANDLNDPQYAQLLVNGVLSDFGNAFSRYSLVSGVMGNELNDATFTAARWPVDQRDVPSFQTRYVDGPEYGVYAPLSTARWAADDVANRLQAWTDAQVPNRARLLATTLAMSAYSHLLLGEGFCSVAIDLSAELPRAEVFRRTEARFSEAIAAAEAAGDANLRQLALIGRARVRLNLGQYQTAAADVRNIPLSFAYTMDRSANSTRQNNFIGAQFVGGSITVSPPYRGLTVDGVPDPRVSVTNSGRITAGVPIWIPTKYATITAPIVIASGREAALIVAEFEARSGDIAVAVNLINSLRATHSLPAFASADRATVLAQVLEERRRELFLESHNLFDLTRLDVPLFPAPGTAYPIEGDSRGGVYGSDRCLPLPDVERFNNPNIP